MNKFDVIIIGSGPGGMAAAYELVSQNKKVAVVETDLWGGTCPNRGCDPKKVLYAAVEAKIAADQLKNHGISQTTEIHWQELMAFKETFTQPVPSEQKKGLEAAGITTITGKAVFEDKYTIIVNDVPYQAETFIIATGQHSALLDIPGKEYFHTSTDFLKMKDLPKTIVFVGGGYISFELATIANSCGSEVHLLNHNEKPLKEFDRKFTAELVEQLTKRGIHFHFNESIEKIQQVDQGLTLSLTSKKVMHTDKVICATGRIPNVEGLNLDKIGVKYTTKGVQVNNQLQTTLENIYALGDCLDKSVPKLTPVSSFEGEYLAKQLVETDQQAIQYPTIPTIIFSSPKLAQVGITGDKVNEEIYEQKEIDLTQWFTYRRLNEPLVKASIVIEKATGLLAGATVLGNEADQLINLFTLAINEKIPMERLNSIIMLYPTVLSDLSYLY